MALGPIHDTPSALPHPHREVLLFVLRRALPRTQCLVSEQESGALEPLVVTVSPDQSESQAVREALAPLPAARVYAVGCAPVPRSTASANVFVAILDEEASADPSGWCTLADTVHRFSTPALRSAGRAVLERFVLRAPDEALRAF